MDNGKISAQITKLADLLEFQGANSFKIRAFRRGARVIKDSTDSFETIVSHNPSQLLQIDGIGNFADPIKPPLTLSNFDFKFSIILSK